MQFHLMPFDRQNLETENILRTKNILNGKIEFSASAVNLKYKNS